MSLRELLQRLLAHRCAPLPEPLDGLTDEQRRDYIQRWYDRAGMLRLDHDRIVNADRARR